jgi:predicted transcriptional regulator
MSQLPDTSHLAKEQFTEDIKEQHHAKILSALEVLGKSIGEDIAKQANMDYHAVMRRLKELVEAGKIYNTLETGLTSKGRKANKYAIRNADTVIPTPEKYNPHNDKAHEYVDGLIQITENHKKEKQRLITGRLEQKELF